MRVLVTGATGLIGSHLVDALKLLGYDVVATGLPILSPTRSPTRSRPKAAGKRRRLAEPSKHPTIRNVDLLDAHETRKLMSRVEAVVHLANAHNWAQKSLSLGTIQNMQMHANVFEAAANAKVKRLIFASSVHVFNGVTPEGKVVPHHRVPYLPLDGLLPPCPVNPYGLSKQFCETILQEISLRTGMTTVALRLPLVDDRDKLSAILHGKVAPYVGAAGAGFSYLSLDDTAALVHAILVSPLSGHSVYFPASRRNLLDQPASVVIPTHYRGVELRVPVDQIQSLVDNRAITRDTRWQPSE